MLHRGLISGLLVALLALPALAAQVQINGDAGPTRGTCRAFLLCDGTDGTGSFTCGGTGNERYARVSGGEVWIALADGSTASAFSCNLYQTDGRGYHATRRSLLTSAAIDETNFGGTSAHPLGDVHAACTGVTGGTLVLRLLVCGGK